MKTDLYINGQYTCSSTRFKNVKEATAYYLKTDRVFVAGRGVFNLTQAKIYVERSKKA